MKKDFEQMVYYATLAPSSHNTQPWRFKVEDELITILPNYHRALPVVDPDNHELFISLGCALENLLIAATRFGYEYNVQVSTGERARIEISLEETFEEDNYSLFEMMDVRQTTRNKYDGKAIESTDLILLKETARQEDVECVIITERNQITPVIELVKEACLLQYSSKEFTKELTYWVRFNNSMALRSHDGLSNAVTKNRSVPSLLGKLLTTLFNTPTRVANKAEELVNSSSALVVFVADRNDEIGWVNLGRSFERFALAATALGIHHAHENMPCEETSVRKKLAELLKLDDGEQPLLLLRIGYSEKMPYSYRRPIKEVIIEPVKELIL
jgi:hypothetical protein